MPASFKSREDNLRDLVGTSASYQLKVPKYQRSYSWKTSNWRDFWKDLLEFHEVGDKTDTYFLGTIIVVRDERDRIDSVLDGQQRLATATILLASLRDYVQTISKTLADEIQSAFICKQVPLKKRLRYGIVLNKYDQEFFESLIQQWPAKPRDADYDSHRLLSKAKEFFDEQVKLSADAIPAEKRLDWINDLADTLVDQFQVIVVIASDNKNAVRVFQVVNDRGVNLSIADLLRVFLLQRAKEEEEDRVVDRWEELLDLGININNFLRYHWVSRHGDAKSKMISLIQDYVEKRKLNSLEYTEELLLDADLYRDIVECKTTDEETGHLLRELDILNAELLVPLFISAFARGKSPEERRPLLRAAIDAFVRACVICQKDQTKFEALVYGTAARLRESGDFVAARRELAGFVLAPPDEEVQKSFQGLKLPANERDLARYLLFRIENHLFPPKEKAIRGPKDVQIEHISPRKPDKDSRLKQHEEYVDRLGNLTLLYGPYNRKAWRHSFEKKRDLFGLSNCGITNDLTAIKDWNEKTIEKRQLAWAKLASTIWPKPTA